MRPRREQNGWAIASAIAALLAVAFAMGLTLVM